MLEISPRTAYHILAKGEGPRTIRVGRHIRILETDLNDWFDAQRQQQVKDSKGSKEQESND